MTVSLSIGIALMRPGMTLSGEELLAAAEEALASAKAAGGNRIAFDRLHGLARLDERARAPRARSRTAAEARRARWPMTGFGRPRYRCVILAPLRTC